jgi:hypothetical protein
MIAPSALLFPYTDLTPVRLARGLVFFKEIILYSLPRNHPDDFLAQALALGLARLRPVGFIEDENEVKRILEDFTRWADNYGQGGYMALLRQHLAQESAESSGTRLMGAIRGRGADSDRPEDTRRQAQMLLHFAQDLDRQRYETSLLLSDVADEEERLGEIMGVEPFESEPEEDEVLAQMTEPMPIPEEPGLDLMPQRLTAWFRFFEAYGRDGACLFTDQPAAVEALDLNLARHRPGREQLQSGRGADILEPFMELEIPAPELGRGAPAPSILSRPRNSWPGWSDFLEKVASRPWPVKDIEQLRQEAARLTPARPDQTSPALILTGYLLPGRDLTEALGEAVGLNPRPGSDDVFCGPVLALKSRGI